jgi:hypothetical protein
MKLTVLSDKQRLLHRLQITKQDAIRLARELLELSLGNGLNAQGTESTHWVIKDELVSDETQFCFGIGEPKPTHFRWAVRVHFSSSCSSRSIDARLESLVGRESDESGYGLGERESVWYYSKRSEALKIMQQLKASKIRGIIVTLIDLDKEGS